ncbi:hypothetical protein HN014_16195 [Aquimarina sp. TRL1]|nr:hypothetical protein HN014_16195 [Aquimarina sp. TRL1]
MLSKCFLVIFLTILTQLGGILYLITELVITRKTPFYRLKKILVFVLVYSLTTFFIIPNTAPLLGRIKIKDTPSITAHTLLTKICNRDYVTPDTYKVLTTVAKQLSYKYPSIKLVYLDANFPFIDGYPLFPHLSHNDGKKIDLSFIYKTTNEKLTNKKPGITGYGVFIPPPNNNNQTEYCKKKGYWQYDITRFFSLGNWNRKLILSEKATKDLLLLLSNQPMVRKIFIEPHLKQRLRISNTKIRFHGCQAVRHDDHIHIQL